MESWQNLDSEFLLKHPMLSVEKTLRRRDDGLEHTFIRLHSPDWVNILPVTSDGQVVMIKQFRHGSDEETLEIPGGLVDPGETPEQAAARELMEETGCRAPKLEYLGKLRPNPAIFSNHCHTFLAMAAAKVAEPQPEDTERIEVLQVAAEDLPGLVAAGAVSNAMVVAAITFYWLKNGLPG